MPQRKDIVLYFTKSSTIQSLRVLGISKNLQCIHASSSFVLISSRPLGMLRFDPVIVVRATRWVLRRISPPLARLLYWVMSPQGFQSKGGLSPQTQADQLFLQAREAQKDLGVLEGQFQHNVPLPGFSISFFSNQCPDF